MQGLQVDETALLKSMFVTCVRYAKSIPVSVAFREYLVRAMEEPWSRPGTTTTACVTLVKLRSAYQAEHRSCGRGMARTFVVRGTVRRGGPAHHGRRSRFARAPAKHPCQGVALERFLTLARSALLDAATTTPATDGTGDDIAAFACMLARQCFINEYVFAYAADEQAKVASLKDQAAAALRAGDPIAVLPLAVIASYEPLYAIAGFEALPARSWPSGSTTF